MTGKVIELPRAVPPPSPFRAELRIRLGVTVTALAHRVRRVLDRLAAALGYCRSERARFERWQHSYAGTLSAEAPRRPGACPGRLINFEAARAARAARRT
jgi:hypothetical protein